MTTIDERREVARRLRECRGGWSSGECYYAIIHALGLPDTSREDGGSALYELLADLIDPSENVKCVAEIKIEGDQLEDAVQKAAAEYAGIDRDALLALADEMDKCAWYFRLEHDEDELRDRLEEASDDFADASKAIRKAVGA